MNDKQSHKTPTLIEIAKAYFDATGRRPSVAEIAELLAHAKAEAMAARKPKPRRTVTPAAPREQGDRLITMRYNGRML